MSTTTAPATHVSSAPSAPSATTKIGWSDYLRISPVLLGLIALLVAVDVFASGSELRTERLLGPIFAMVALTALVWLSMVVVRNVAILRGLATPAYYVAYQAAEPPEWIERPARTFNNLMQVPTLFYVVGLLMLVTQAADRAQLLFAWIYVAIRVVHAGVYIVWNSVPYRFATWLASCIVLGVIWVRFALQAWPGW